MTREQQRIAIAEAVGKDADYLNDLNAMHEAEASLFGRNDWSASKYEILLTRMTSYWAWHATASQRAEAFLRTIGKWEDGK